MLEHDFKDFDDVLEYAATIIEDTDFSDLRGVWAKRKRKRDREDAELRLKTSEEVRRRCAEQIRAMKKRPELTPLGILQTIAKAEEDYRGHVHHLREAWPLAWRGWVNIECTMQCNSNGIPPETNYRITLTDKGRKALAAG